MGFTLSIHSKALAIGHYSYSILKCTGLMMLSGSSSISLRDININTFMVFVIVSTLVAMVVSSLGVIISSFLHLLQS